MSNELDDLGKVIQVVLGKANPNRMNGVNNVVHYLSKELKQQGEDVEVWGVTDINSADTLERNYKLALFPNFKFRVIPGLELLKSIKSLDKDKVLFHFHGSYIIEFGVVCLILKLLGFKWVVTPHGGYAENALKKNSVMKRLYVNTIDRVYIKGALLIHALADIERENMLKVFPDKRVTTISNGVPYNEEMISIYQGTTRPYFVFCGRLSAEKGLDRMLSGYMSYISDGGESDLVIIGDGESKHEIIRFVEEHNLENNVILKGALFGDEKNQVISAAIAFIATSYNEGFPIAILEAMALNKPVIVSRETNLGSLVEEQGVGVCLDDCSPKHVSSAFRFVESHVKEYGYKPSDVIKNHYTWRHVAYQISDMYKNI